MEVTRAGGADSPTAALAADYLSKRELLGAKTRVRGIDLSCTEEVWGSTLSSSGTHLGKGCGCDEMASDVLDAWLDGAGAVKATFVYGLHVNVPEYMSTSSGTYRFVHDHLGSPRLLVDSSSGAVVQRMDYDSFGRVLSDTSPGFQPFGFAGGLWDRDTGLVRFGARDYDPSVGRWTNKDPVSFNGGWNLCGYVDNDPVNFIDAEGLSKYDKLFGLPKKFWRWYHRDPFLGKKRGDLDLPNKEEAKELYEEWQRLGEPGPDHDWDDILDIIIPLPPFFNLCAVVPEMCKSPDPCKGA